MEIGGDQGRSGEIGGDEERSVEIQGDRGRSGHASRLSPPPTPTARSRLYMAQASDVYGSGVYGSGVYGSGCLVSTAHSHRVISPVLQGEITQD